MYRLELMSNHCPIFKMLAIACTSRIEYLYKEYSESFNCKIDTIETKFKKVNVAYEILKNVEEINIHNMLVG